MAVKRYDLEYCNGGRSEHREMMEDPLGDWVKWSDIWCNTWVYRDNVQDSSDCGNRLPCKEHPDESKSW